MKESADGFLIFIILKRAYRGNLPDNGILGQAIIRRHSPVTSIPKINVFILKNLVQRDSNKLGNMPSNH
jgi:hypothetical protein